MRFNLIILFEIVYIRLQSESSWACHFPIIDTVFQGIGRWFTFCYFYFGNFNSFFFGILIASLFWIQFYLFKHTWVRFYKIFHWRLWSCHRWLRWFSFHLWLLLFFWSQYGIAIYLLILIIFRLISFIFFLLCIFLLY